MEKTLKEEFYEIPSIVNRIVDLKITDYDRGYPVEARITYPEGFESHQLQIIKKGSGLTTAVHKWIGNNRKKLIHTRVKIRTYQVIPDEKPATKEVAEEVKLNEELLEKPEKKKGLIKHLMSGKVRPKDLKVEAIRETEARKERLTEIRGEVNSASALTPVGLDGQTILTGDNVDYSRGVGIIWNAIKLQRFLNAQEGNKGANEQKLLCEYYDTLSFSGIGQIIGFYIALGDKIKGDGDLEYLYRWYVHELSKIFSPTNIGEIKKKGAQFLNGVKPTKFRKPPNPGLSINYAEKVIGDFFKNENTGEPFRLRDLQSEVYQPIFFIDEQSRVYTKAETPDAKIVDVIINTGLDPRYFQSRKIENGLISAGPIRRSFDLPIAQNNKRIKIVSFGASLEYKETPENIEGLNDAQVNRVDKSKTKRIDWLDTKKYMENHSNDVSYLRIESAHRYGVSPNSISINDLMACKDSAEKSKAWTNNGSKPEIEWR